MLRNRIHSYDFEPYIYMYPTPRMFAPITKQLAQKPLYTNDINLYFHIPFCHQKCLDCPYYTVTIGHKEHDADFQDHYVRALIEEIYQRGHEFAKRNIKTINFGGGTPSLLTEAQLGNIIEVIVEVNHHALKAAEISIEATPESITYDKFLAFQILGINRVSLGVESFFSNEIKALHRHNSTQDSVTAIRILQSLSIQNICVDLMYGVPGQTVSTWRDSVSSLVGLKPDTIELYSTVSKGLQHSFVMDNRQRLESYQWAREYLLDAGYKQDCHLRFVLNSNGGYRQQANVFAGQSVLGFGVGARTYANNVHFRNCSGTNTTQGVLEYMERVNNGQSAIDSYVLLSSDELVRKYAIYNLEHLNKIEFWQRYGMRFEDKFPEQYYQMLILNLLVDDGETICLTDKGLAFRDVVAKEFFSKQALACESQYRLATA